MRIVIDLQGAQTESRFRGIGRYSLSLAKAIVRNRGEHEIILALNGLFPDTIEPIQAAFDGLLPKKNIVVWHSPGPVRELETGNEWRREVAEYIREAFIISLQPDVLLVTSLFEGFIDNAVTSIGKFSTHIKTAVIIYDLIPLLNPELYLKPNSQYSQYYLKKIEYLKRATRWLAISESAAKEGQTSLSLAADALTNISTACDDIFHSSEMSEIDSRKILTKFGISQPFLLYSGGADERKNLKRLILAYASLPMAMREGHQLVLAGRMPEGEVTPLQQAARAVGIDKKQLIFTGYITDEELACLYSKCAVFVFPSLHEGFGLPALEAMACGAPVIGADTTSVPEVIGRQDALFNPNDEASISQKIAQVLGDAKFRAELAAFGLNQAKRFSWDESAKSAIRVFEGFDGNNFSNHSYSWRKIAIKQRDEYSNLIEVIASITQDLMAPSDLGLILIAECLAKNQIQTKYILRAQELPEKITWRVEGPFDSSYSLALLNRETARALDALNQRVILHSTEGPGDFLPNQNFLDANPDIARLYARSQDLSLPEADVTSRNIYPPRVSDMDCRMNLLHHYAWEESGFPMQWVENFNEYLEGMTCLSNHVEKIMIDHGVVIPMSVSGCGVDHWERIKPDHNYHLTAKSFRFLHVSSCFPRKGVDFLIKAYGRVFTSHDDVTLVIKTFPNPHNEIYKWLEDAKVGRYDFPSVLIIEDDLTEAQLKSLYEKCDVLVAPSMAEGFGLPMAEAILSGLAVITTGWGGQLDFCNENTAWLVDYSFEKAKTHFDLFDSVWAKPDIEHLAKTMQIVHDMPEAFRHERVVKGRDFLLKNFRWVDVANRLVSSARVWSKLPIIPQPHIGWVTTWNTRCGIANYSAHLLENIRTEVTILAARTSQLTQTDGAEVVRCWNPGEQDKLDELSKQIDKCKIDTLIVQFNYGFFNLDYFGQFLNKHLDAGRVVILMMHSTSDPAHLINKKLEIIKKPLARCARILVHAAGDLNRLKALQLVENVALFPHGIRDYQIPLEQDFKSSIPNPLNNCFTIASYGFFLPHKGLCELIEAVALLTESGANVLLHMVNAEYPVPESASLIHQANERVSELNLSNRIKITTAFLPDDESLALLSQADLIIFPYQNTGESSSAAVRAGLATGRPVAVTPLSIFDDVAPAVHMLPGNTPYQISLGIKQLMYEIASGTTNILEKNAVAARWRDAHLYSRLSQRLYGMTQALVQKKFR